MKEDNLFNSYKIAYDDIFSKEYLADLTLNTTFSSESTANIVRKYLLYNLSIYIFRLEADNQEDKNKLIISLSKINSFKKLLTAYVSDLKDTINKAPSILKERKENLNKFIKDFNLNDGEIEKIHKEINSLEFSELTRLAYLDIDQSNKNYKGLEPIKVYSLAYGSYLFLTKKQAIEKAEIKEISNFKYDNENDRKKADRLTKRGLKELTNHYKNIVNNEFSPTLPKAKENEIISYSNSVFRDGILRIFKLKTLIYDTEFKKLITRYNTIVDSLENDTLSDFNKKELREERNELETIIKSKNIVDINGTYKEVVNANPNNVNIYNSFKDKSLIVVDFKQAKLTITFHTTEFKERDKYDNLFLDKILTKAYNEKTRGVVFTREEINEIFTHKAKKNLLNEVMTAKRIFLDQTISTTYFDRETNSNIKLTTNLIDTIIHNENDNTFAVILTSGVYGWLNNCYYKRYPKAIDNLSKTEYKLLATTMYNDTAKEWQLTEIGERLGTPTLEHIDNTSRHYELLLNPSIDYLKAIINSKVFEVEGIDTNNPPKTKKDIKDTKVKVKGKRK